MRKIVRKIVEYECRVCGNRYCNAQKAKECEKRVKEPKKFRIGDRVRVLEFCSCNTLLREKVFRPPGMVKKIVGPELMDAEESLKWLGGRLFDMHVFQYRVSFDCLCGRKRVDQLYSVQLRKIGR